MVEILGARVFSSKQLLRQAEAVLLQEEGEVLQVVSVRRRRAKVAQRLEEVVSTHFEMRAPDLSRTLQSLFLPISLAWAFHPRRGLLIAALQIPFRRLKEHFVPDHYCSVLYSAQVA